ncbi:phosphoribosylformylglycinamidine synthase subunit PurS [Candidatus Bathyarchaeota archaeon]|nr:phosphoribosylformylglycinamidine synthase subunit PurS [Candidatus Bathyarchaeota archaeon]MBS7627855.1 phosphoribosylformylglycinamidine synthase subunit PurS [Candidatus Bathyarchaeota archaeon]
MVFRVTVFVNLKEGYSDPEGEATEKSLRDLGYDGIHDVRVGKIYRMVLEAPSRKEAEAIMDQVCRRFLANPVKDDYRFVLEEEWKAP